VHTETGHAKPEVGEGGRGGPVAGLLVVLVAVSLPMLLTRRRMSQPVTKYGGGPQVKAAKITRR
jgi:hypothetical protein